ncbi:hypothetical protein AVEN_238498-1, partial [Araneus ventricosus]
CDLKLRRFPFLSDGAERRGPNDRVCEHRPHVSVCPGSASADESSVGLRPKTAVGHKGINKHSFVAIYFLVCKVL